MRTIPTILAALAGAALALPAPARAVAAQEVADAGGAGYAASPSLEEGARLPPPPRVARDTVDVALYQRARQAMAGGDHGEAAALFRRLVEEHPGSEYAPDAWYWHAFNLYRHRPDDAETLASALGALARQTRGYPAAPTRRNGEAAALETRIRGRLASRGDEAAARAVRAAAEQATCGEETLEMRSAAMSALVEIGPDEALPIFRDLLAREGGACVRELRLRVPWLLARLDSPEASALLLEMARTAEDPEIRGRAVTHLGRTDDPAAAAYLEELARRGPEELRGKAMYALVSSGSPRGGEVLRSIAADPSADEELRKTAIGYLGRSDTNFLPFFERLFRDAPGLRGSIAYAVSEQEGPRAMEWLLEVALDTSLDVEVRKTALYRAGWRDDGLDAYLAVWDRLESPTLRSSFIYGLSDRDDPRALDFLIGLARTEEDPEARKSAIYWLGRSDDPRAVEVLKEIIGGGP